MRGLSFIILLLGIGCPVTNNVDDPEITAAEDCTQTTTDILKDTAWGQDAHGHQRIRFTAMAPNADSLVDGSHATSHFTIEFEEDGFDFSYFIECQYDNGDYAMIMADYYNAWVDGWDPSAGVIEENIEYYYPRFRIEEVNGSTCLFVSRNQWALRFWPNTRRTSEQYQCNRLAMLARRRQLSSIPSPKRDEAQ